MDIFILSKKVHIAAKSIMIPTTNLTGIQPEIYLLEIKIYWKPLNNINFSECF